jgi:hypothetical protein
MISLFAAAFLFLSLSGPVSAAQPGAPTPAEKTETTTRTNPDGSTTTTYRDGSTYTIYRYRDNTTTRIDTKPDGSTTTTDTNPDGSTTTTDTYPDGSTTYTRTNPDRSTDSTRTQKNPDGSTTETSTGKSPDGRSTYTTTITTRTNPDGSTTRTQTFPDGSTSTTTKFRDGSWVERDRDGKITFHDPPRKDPPPKVVGAVPRTPTDTFVAVNNREQTNVGILPGQDPKEAAKALGGTILATGPQGAIISTVGDPKTVEKRAQEIGLKTNFVEKNFCTIMTPLTPFRGHDHKAHEQSGRGPHDHDAPDPGPDWGVTPPEMVVRLE